MNKIQVLLLFFVLCTSVGAQKTVLSFDPDLANNEQTKKTSYESYVIDNDNQTGMSAIVLTDHKTIEYILLNKEFGVVSHFTPADGLKNKALDAVVKEYIGGSIENEKAHFFYYVRDKSLNEGKGHYRLETVDFKTKKVDSKYLFELSSGESYIQSFTSQRSFYLMASSEKTDELVIKFADENGKVNNKRVALNLDGFAKSKYKIKEYLAYPHKFRPDEESELIGATDLAKIYPYSDKIIIIVANWKDNPDIWTIDTKTFHASGKKWELNGFYGYGAKKEKAFTNAYLYKENLYVLNNSKEKIEVGIFNMASGQLIKKYEIDESANFKFIETPVEITTKGRKTWRNTITSNKELIKELSKGSLGVAVAQNSKGQLILTCGVYDKEMLTTSGYNMGGFSPTSTPTGRIYAGSNIPVTTTTYTFNPLLNHVAGREYSYTRTVNFRITLDPSTFDLITSNSEISTLDKMNIYLSSMTENSVAENIFRQGDKYLLSYYNPKMKKFSIIEMEK